MKPKIFAAVCLWLSLLLSALYSFGSRAENTASPVAFSACGEYDVCPLGQMCNTYSHKCVPIVVDGCGGLGEPCCPPTATDATGCGGFGQCFKGVCQVCGGEQQLCCDGQKLTPACVTGLGCGGLYCSKTFQAENPIFKTLTNPQLIIMGGSDFNLYDYSGKKPILWQSTDQAQTWQIPPTKKGKKVNNALTAQTFLATPFIYRERNQNPQQLIALKADQKYWRFTSSDDGQSWQADQHAISEHEFTSSASIVKSQHQRWHLFGRLKNQSLGHLISNDNGQHWTDIKNTFNNVILQASPIAVSCQQGRQLHLFVLAQNGQYKHLSSDNNGQTWTAEWVAIGDEKFTTPPAVAVSEDGKIMHIFGRHLDGRIWRTASTDAGLSWSTPWTPVSDGLFSSGPVIWTSDDAQTIHLFARGTETPISPTSAPAQIWRAYSPDGGKTWPVGWAPLNIKSSQEDQNKSSLPTHKNLTLKQINSKK